MTRGEALSPIERIRRCTTLTDARALVSEDKRFVTLWDREATDFGTSYTFGHFWNLSEGYARLLRESGLRDGDVTALILPHGVELMACFMGVILAGGIPTILAYPNFKIHPDKYRQGLQGVTANVRARFIVLDESFPSEFREIVRGQTGTEVILIEAAATVQTRPPCTEPSGVRPEDTALLQHSAGTTGLQKGVALTHRLVLNQLRPLAEALEICEEDRIANWLPLYHDMGLIACFLLPLVAGIEVIAQSPVQWVMQPRSFLEIITRFRCTMAWVPNFTFQFLSRRIQPQERAGLDLSSLKALTTTSEPIRFESLQEFSRSFESHGLNPAALQSSYGMAESVFAVTQSRVGRPPEVIWADAATFHEHGRIRPADPQAPGARAFVSCGAPLGSNWVRAVSPEGDPLPEGELGEIVVKTDYLFDGYHNRPDLTKKVLRDGWYHTSDAGFVLDGEVFVIGRMDDSIIVGGRNFYPQDLEEIACQNPLVHDGRAVAFGLENAELGTQDIVIIAEVSRAKDLEHGPTVANQIRQQVLLQLGVAPRHVHVVEPRWLIKSTAGKPARSANRQKMMQVFGNGRSRREE